MPLLFALFDQLASVVTQIISQFSWALQYLNIPIPIGIIGVWRWSVWLLRRFIGFWYKAQEPNGYPATTAIITPVYNEDPELFRAALRSWAANNPKEIIAVIDHTDTPCMEQFHEFEEECAEKPLSLKMLVTQTPGKRPALADGILVATSEVVFLVDSDTVWDPDVLPKALAPFHDPKVGGVTVRQRVLAPATTAQRIFDVYLDIRYIDEIRFLTAFGDAVTCLSGRTAVYRRAVALTALDDLMEETFWGRPVISGDDKALTLAVQSRGWKVRYQANTCVYTPGATVMRDFLKQRLRWARNSWRADLKALGSRWAWRKPILAFHLCDRLLQPLTTLVAPLYLLYALFQQNWPAVLILIGWWTISRTIKIWPHLQRSWRNIRILPWYITFSYWSAITKIYAFFTMNQQGWITRWSRGGKVNAWAKFLQAAPSYTATTATVLLVAIFINWLHASPSHATEPATIAITIAEPKRGFHKELIAETSLCILTGVARGECTTYPIMLPTITMGEQLQTAFVEYAGALKEMVGEWLRQRIPRDRHAQAAGKQNPTTQPSDLPRQWLRNPSGEVGAPTLLCATNNGEEQMCVQYEVD